MPGLSAEELLKRAEKKATSSGGWLSPKKGNKEEAIELYKEAANKLRADTRMDEAGVALLKAAELEVETDEKDFAANTFFDASKCFRMSRPDRMCRVLTDRGCDGDWPLLRPACAAWSLPPGSGPPKVHGRTVPRGPEPS